MERQKQYMTIQEVSDLLRLTTRSIYNLIQRGSLPKIKINGSRRTLINRQDVEKLLEKE